MSSDTRIQAVDVAVDEHGRRLVELIRKEAAARGGLLPFDRFMELALYAPGLGYYMAGARKLGREGDFITAPELSPLFGRCIAAQCREVLDTLGGGDILEFGAGSGVLAADVLSALACAGHLPGRYFILDLSPDLRERQQSLIAERVPALAPRVRWLDHLPEGFNGCVLANEVLDAMPVHRFRIGVDGEPLELFASPESDGWAQAAGEPVSHGLLEAVLELQDEGLALDPGYESEINLRLGPWIEALAESMERGLVLLIDYGYPRNEYYRADRNRGTLMCHYLHRAHTDPFVVPGFQDISAHVDFTAVARAGSAAGLRLGGYATQAHFLIGCGLERMLADAAGGADAVNLVLGAKQLVLPTAMGERFHVPGLEKEIRKRWMGFSFRDLRNRLGGYGT
jgi:SAM-dependent MidA family methyltransferase